MIPQKLEELSIELKAAGGEVAAEDTNWMLMSHHHCCLQVCTLHLHIDCFVHSKASSPPVTFTSLL